MLRTLLLTAGLVCSLSLAAQLQFDGLWEGTITVGGIHSQKGYPVQLYLERAGKQVTGRSYIHLSESRVIEVSLRGRIYDDLSVSLDEVEYISQADGDLPPDFLRKYQLVWHRSLGGGTLNGYWQEIRKEIFDQKRERGKIFLKKVVNNKA